MSNVANLDFRYLVQNQKKINANDLKKDNKQLLEYDFKIVSFKIGNEYYGINIMSVKEILKEKKFTKIPNSLEFVRGVLNLRGDIMPVIDLAKMFNLKTNTNTNKDELCSIIIVKVDGLLIGLIVEQIQHVIPIRKADIQPPSPLLGNINERYITGVVDLNNRLYVILDTDAIFSDKEKTKKETIPQESDLSEEFFSYFINQISELCGVHITSFNKNKFRELYKEYIKENNIKDLPKITKDIADKILNKFLSINTNEFWESSYVDKFCKDINPFLSKICSDDVRVFEIGCGSGYETYSIYIALKNLFPDSNIKITAVDTNLALVSSAATLEVMGYTIPVWMRKEENFINTGGEMYKIKKEINNNIYFEFHDAKNILTNSKVYDMVIARDLSLHLKEAEYAQFIEDVSQKLVKGGVLVIGDNEYFSNNKFTKQPNCNINLYTRN